MILDDILARTHADLAKRKALYPEGPLRERLADVPPTLDVRGILRNSGVSIVAEIKRASPSRGALNATLDPARLAVTYATAGCDAISVLTEGPHFHGSLDDLSAVRDALRQAEVRRPLLRKDFVVDRYQLIEARVGGADAVLLIVAALGDAALAGLFEDAQELGLTPWIEVHNQAELERALPLEPPIIGINNRDLTDFSVNLETTRQLRPLIPSYCAVVSESGIHGPAQMRELHAMGVDAALIGEALVTVPDPAAKLKELREAGR
ncbi:MAG: hypothetical protein A2Y73_02610 [Chloroflexi bacterium RBG_13_56_8]|nr:MAG: hypothetical protein A2Y73_02610 [Chloroflexi bacterium RBG_13_56_8]